MSLSVDPRIGSELFGYRLDALLGRGGMGVVYRAYDPRLKRHVALKLIAPELVEGEPFRDCFLTETEVAASLEHPRGESRARDPDRVRPTAIRVVGVVRRSRTSRGVRGTRRVFEWCRG